MGLILDTSVIVRAERRGKSVSEILAQIRGTYGETEVGVSVVTIAELAHGVARSKLESQRLRSQAFSGQEAARGITLPFEDLLIGATALQLGFELLTHNARHFEMIPHLVVKQP